MKDLTKKQYQFAEVIADLALNAGNDKLHEVQDNSRELISSIIYWAREFMEIHAHTNWDTTDYILTVDEFYQMKADEFRMEHEDSL